MKRPALSHLAIIALLAAAPAWGMSGDSGSSSSSAPADTALEKANAAIAAKDWAQAQALLRDAVARDPKKAEVHNLYAYSIRMGANPAMDLVFRHYNEALRLDPKHRGAHEYIGEAYLMTGNLAKAKEHLAELDKLCFFGCEELSKLKKAVADYEQKQAKK
jgi:cytochrome c-type biogenesis protein CcmH/NrfG